MLAKPHSSAIISQTNNYAFRAKNPARTLICEPLKLSDSKNINNLSSILNQARYGFLLDPKTANRSMYGARMRSTFAQEIPAFPNPGTGDGLSITPIFLPFSQNTI
jgi:hypothetical protein